MRKSRHRFIAVLTGAGISAESGIRTFRDQNGLWEEYCIEDVATPEAFQRNPDLVHRFYNARRAQLLSPEVKPNPAHDALARLERECGCEFLLITQNIDNLHERAGSKNLIHMHGELLKTRCSRSGQIFEYPTDLVRSKLCDCCHLPGMLRPHVVWFGEMPFAMDQIDQALRRCTVFIAIGTSGQVYPAAGFVRYARQQAHTIEINADRSMMSDVFHENIQGKASLEVPLLVDRLLASEPGTHDDRLRT